MNKSIGIIGLFLIGNLAFAANIKLDDTEANCRKVDGYGANDKMAIASQFKVPLSSVSFIGAKWGFSQYGSRTCVFVFDTAKGPKQCSVLQLLSDDNGKTAFGSVAPFGNSLCWE